MAMLTCARAFLPPCATRVAWQTWPNCPGVVQQVRGQPESSKTCWTLANNVLFLPFIKSTPLVFAACVSCSATRAIAVRQRKQCRRPIQLFNLVRVAGYNGCGRLRKEA